MSRLPAITGSAAAAFDPDKNLPSLHGKAILVTGGSSGLGKEAIIYLARHNPAEIWLTARTSDEAERACGEIKEKVPGANVQPLGLNLASFKSIKEAAVSILARLTRLDVLMLNAGVMGTPPGLTDDGYEVQFGINYVGHALLTKLLLPLLHKTADAGHDARVIVLTSHSHWNAPAGGIQFDTLKTPAEALPSLQRYAQSKLAGIFFARQLAREQPKLRVVAVHPGAANTGLQAGATDIGFVERLLGATVYRALLYQPAGVVAKNQVWAAAAAADGLVSGEYYEPLGVVGQPRPEARDGELAERLWEWTEAELQVYL